jgi:hypothetical protein
MRQDERDPVGNTIDRFSHSKHAVEDDRPSPCIVAAMCEAGLRAVCVARRNSGMDDGDPSTVNEEKQRCSLP